MKLMIFSLLFSAMALAQDYSLYQAENSHYQDYSREELIARLGESSALLPYYQCNGRDEFDPFWAAVRENSLGDSFKVSVNETDEVITYKNGQYFKASGEIQTDFSNSFVASVAVALEKIESIPEGAVLLRNLERSHFPITVTLGGNSFVPVDDAGQSYRGIYSANALSIFSYGRMTNENVPFNNIGAGGFIRWNPKTREVQPHIALAHEMYHAFDSVRGILDMRFVKGDNYEFTLVSEYRAVYFENIARKAAGVSYRTHYGQVGSGPGVLDENGEPRKMPSPCLSN